MCVSKYEVQTNTNFGDIRIRKATGLKCFSTPVRQQNTTAALLTLPVYNSHCAAAAHCPPISTLLYHVLSEFGVILTYILVCRQTFPPFLG